MNKLYAGWRLFARRRNSTWQLWEIIYNFKETNKCQSKYMKDSLSRANKISPNKCK